MYYRIMSSPSNTSLHPLERFWIALARLNGACGQVLGQAVSAKDCHDSVRSWVCCLLAWYPVAIFDKQLPGRATSLSTCLSELQELIATHPESLKDDPTVKFVVSALTTINACCNDLAASKTNLISKVSIFFTYYMLYTFLFISSCCFPPPVRTFYSISQSCSLVSSLRP